MWEILQAWAVFSVLFEAILPQFPHTFHTVGDPLDVVAYLFGGMLAATIWRATPRPPPPCKIRRDHFRILNAFPLQAPPHAGMLSRLLRFQNG
jgi:hypothetical protein